MTTTPIETVKAKDLSAGWRIETPFGFRLINGLDFTQKDGMIKVEIQVQTYFILLPSLEEIKVKKSWKDN